VNFAPQLLDFSSKPIFFLQQIIHSSAPGLSFDQQIAGFSYAGLQSWYIPLPGFPEMWLWLTCDEFFRRDIVQENLALLNAKLDVLQLLVKKRHSKDYLLWKLCEFVDSMVKSLGLNNTICDMVVVFKPVQDAFL